MEVQLRKLLYLKRMNFPIIYLNTLIYMPLIIKNDEIDKNSLNL